MILKDIYFFNGATSTGDSEILYNENKGSVLSIQIDCNGTFNIEVQGCIDIESGVYSQVFATNMLTSDREESITESGIYQVDIDGYRRIKLVLKSIGSSPITAYGAMKEKGGQTDIEDDVATKDYVNAAVAGKEDISNKVTTISLSSTDTEYPSAKCVYDAIQQGGGGGGESKYFVYLDMPMQAGDLPFTCSADDQAKIEAICDAYDEDNTVLKKYLIINTKYGFNISPDEAQQMKVFTVYSISSSQVVFRSNNYVKATSNSTYYYTDISTQYISVTYTRSSGAMTVSFPNYAQYGFKDRAYTAEKDLTVPQYSSMPTAGSSYSGQIAQYKGTTDSNYTNGYFYTCNNSGGSYAWHQLNVQPSGSQVPIYNYVSGSSSTDYGTSTSSSAVNGRINLSSLAKGLHVFQNYSTGTALNFKYMKTGASSYTNGSLNSYSEPITNSTSYFKTFTIEVIEDMSSGLDSYAANTTLAIVTFYESNNNYSWKYKISVNTSSSSKAVQTFIIEKNANTLYMKSAYTTANSASSTANQAAQQASTNASAITALDTRVTALEQGGGGGGGGQTEYVSDEGGTPYPPSNMWSTSSGNYFNFAKNTAEFKEGSSEFIYVTLTPDQMYNDKIGVDINYNYTTAMPDTSDVVIPNVIFKVYSANDDSELSSIDVGDVTLVYDSMSNKWAFNKYDVSFTYIMSGQNVYCKMFYGNGGSSSGGSLSITEIITEEQNSPGNYYLDPTKIKNICSGKTVRFHILASELQNKNVSYLYIRDGGSSIYKINDFSSMAIGYLDITCDEEVNYGFVRIVGMMVICNGSTGANSYKMFIECNNGMYNSCSLWTQSWTAAQ